MKNKRNDITCDYWVGEIDERFRSGDLNDLCDATEAAIAAGGGFGWVRCPPRESMERYWRGILAAPHRRLFIARLDGVICGATQLTLPTPNNEAQAHSCSLTTTFISPWARGHGLSTKLTLCALHAARDRGIKVANLAVRETQDHALAVYRNLGFVEFGRHPHYAQIDEKPIPGLYLTLNLEKLEKQES